MLKGQKIYIDKEQGKTKHEASRSVNYRATQSKNNIGTTALNRSVVYTTGGGGLKASHCTNFTLGPDTHDGPISYIYKQCFLNLSICISYASELINT